MIVGAWRRARPWLTAALITVEVALVWSGLLPLRIAVFIGVAVEALLLVVAATGAVAGARRFRAGGPPVSTAGRRLRTVWHN